MIDFQQKNHKKKQKRDREQIKQKCAFFCGFLMYDNVDFLL